VPSPKTEHHKGKAYRLMPLFPELRALLEPVCPSQPPSDLPVITRYRMSNIQLRKRFLATMERARISAWPRLFQNLRASRETELVEQFPGHVVAAWLGHSVMVAEAHYLQVTDEHFILATRDTDAPPPWTKGRSFNPQLGDGITVPLLQVTLHKHK